MPLPTDNPVVAPRPKALLYHEFCAKEKKKRTIPGIELVHPVFIVKQGETRELTQDRLRQRC